MSVQASLPTAMKALFMHVNKHLGLIKSLELSGAEITEDWTDKYYIVSVNEMGPTAWGSSEEISNLHWINKMIKIYYLFISITAKLTAEHMMLDWDDISLLYLL